MIGQTVSHYRIIERLGAGGMGTVYLAEDTVLGRRVAIKTLTDLGPGNQHFRTRFLREARAVSALSHPHIATIHDYGETPDGQPYIVMEFIKGETLADLMHKESLTIPRALEIVSEVAEALGEAHSHGIIHRDIKPSNIALNQRGKVKVLDFGLAKQIEAGVVDSLNPEGQTLLNTQTREGVIVGTPMYLSPEQALGVEVDRRSDLFSLGAVLYECLAGKPPFFGGSAVEICAKVIRDDPAPPSQSNANISKELDRIALKALAKKQDARYQNADELISDLNEARAEAAGFHQTITRAIKVAPGTHPTGALATLSDIFKRPRLSVGYVIAGVVAVALLGIIAWKVTRPTLHVPSPQTQRLYERGVDAMRQGAFFRASKILQQVVEADSGFALAHARLAETWSEMDFSDKAKEEFIRATDLVPDRSSLPRLDSLRLQAIGNVVKRDFGKAIEDYQSIVTLIPEAERPYALVDLGRAFEKNQEPHKATNQYREAIKLDPSYAAAFLRLAVVLRRSQKFEEASNTFDQASKLFTTSNEIEGVTEVLIQRGIMFSQQGKVAEARAQLNQALTKSEAFENPEQRIKTLLQLSNTSIVGGNADEASQYSAEALKLAQTHSIETLTTAGLLDLGNAFLARGKLSEADGYFDQALRIAQSYKLKNNEARALLSLGSLRTRQTKPLEAKTFVERALDFYQRGEYRKETSQAYALLGYVHDQLGEYDAAINAFGEQLKIAEEVGDPQQVALSHEGMGVALNHRQNYPAALAHFDQQLAIVRTLNNKIALAYSIMNRGTMLWQVGRYEEAKHSLSEAVQIAESTGREPPTDLLAWISVSKAQMALSRRELPLAIIESRRALELAGEEFKGIAVRATYTLGLAQSLSGQTQAGRRTCENALEMAKALSDPLAESHALLALATAAATTGTANNEAAATIAKQAQERFASANQHHSEWQAWIVQAKLAINRGNTQGAREASLAAAAVLTKLEQEWGSQNYQGFLDRSDVKQMRGMVTL